MKTLFREFKATYHMLGHVIKFLHILRNNLRPQRYRFEILGNMK